MKLSRELNIDHIEENKFFKLSPNKYLQLLNVEPIQPQIALLNALNYYRYIVGCFSRRTGKTYIANIAAQLVALIPNSNVLVIAPNYSLSSISWDLQKSLINKFNLEVVKSNAKDRVIELANGSSIRIGSVQTPDAVVGRSYDLILFDEAALNDNGADVFNTQLLPTLDTIAAKAIFISTPRGANWFKDFYDRGFDINFPEWISILSTWKDNPRTPIEVVEMARKSMSRAEFAQEFLCEFTINQGQIFELSSDCVVDSVEDFGETIIGIDVGFRDPTAICVIRTDGHKYYIVDEYLEAEKSTEYIASRLSEFIEQYNVDFVYIDSAHQQLRFDLASRYDIATINANKDVLSGIGYVQSLIDNSRVIVLEDCVKSLEMFNNYSWDTRVGLLREKPKHDMYSHMADAIRYACYSHSYNLEE